MARALRIDEPGGWHHVMSRGRNRGSIFVDDIDRRRFLEIASTSCEKTSVEIHAFVLMGNHYHLLLRCPDAGLSKTMQRINGAYVRHVNWRHAYDGSLFKGRFHSLTVETHAYLVELVRYIHRNPVAAGMVDSASSFRWSSHNQYLGRAELLDNLMSEEILRYFNGDRSRFDRFVAASDSAKAQEVIEAIDARHPAVGSEERFVDLVRQSPVCGETNQAAVRMLRPRRVAAAEAWVARRLDVTVDELLDRSNGNRHIPLLLAVLHDHKVCSLAEAARRYGYARRSSVGSAITRLLAKPDDAAFVAQLSREFALFELHAA